MSEFFGEENFDNSGRIYLDLRAGYIGETKSIDLDENGEPVKRKVEEWRQKGYELDFTTNKAGKKTYFMAKIRKSIGGYVTGLRWYANSLDNGVTLTGWKVSIETPDQTYILQIGSQDRPYSRFMNTLLNVDFNHTVRFKGYKKDDKKNLLLYQGSNDGKDYILGKHKECYLNAELRAKLRDGQPLNDKDRENVMFDEQGAIRRDYPYIYQKADGKWSFDQWEEFLMDEIKKYVIPAIETANAARGDWRDINGPEPDRDYTGPAGSVSEAIERSDSVTSEQIGIINKLAQELAIDVTKLSVQMYGCYVDELSKGTAHQLIEHLKTVALNAPTRPAEVDTAGASSGSPGVAGTQADPDEAAERAAIVAANDDIPF